MDFVASFSALVLARVTLRASNDIGDRIYDTGVSVGKDLFQRMRSVAQTGDADAVEAAAAEYAAHLEQHPDERERVLPAVVDVAVRDEPLAVLESIVVGMCHTAQQVRLDPPVAGVAGCAAFAGSLAQPTHVTVVDVRGPGTDHLVEIPTPSALTATGTGLSFDYEFPGFTYAYASAPRMWIVTTSDERHRDAVVEELNRYLTAKRSNPHPHALRDAVDTIVNGGTGDLARGELRQVRSVYPDRLDIYYPNHAKDRRLAAEPELAERVALQMRVDDVDRLRERELTMFDIDDTEGVRVLLASVEQVQRNNDERLAAHEQDWAVVRREIRALGRD